MKRVPVRSTSVASVGYDPERFVLELEFLGGAVYRYSRVPAAVHRLLLQADSIGRFVNSVIKPRFDAVHVLGEKQALAEWPSCLSAPDPDDDRDVISSEQQREHTIRQ
jgi:hypothetical protein